MNGGTRSPAPPMATSPPELNTPGFWEGGGNIKVLVCTCNIGNKMPTSLDAWIPYGGVRHDVIAIGMQESTFRVKVGGAKEADDDGVDVEDDDDEEERVTALEDSGLKREELSPEDVELVASPPSSPLRDRVSSHHSQSMIASTTANQDTDGTAYIKELIGAQLPDYYLVSSVRRLQMRLRVYARVEIKHRITDVTYSAENTGIAGVVANKGGLVIALKVADTSLCFISCHLAAHEGSRYLARRHENCREIINGARVGNKAVDLDCQFSHAFFMGDLNYRLDPSMHPLLSSLPWANQRAAIMKLINDKDWATLYSMDELQRELAAGMCLSGFKTAPCSFPPTFKAVRGVTDGYNEKRMPSYTDRVLYRSHPALEECLRLVQYQSCPEFLTSDHKPVRASFVVEPTPPVPTHAVTRGFPRVTLYELSAGDLPVMDVQVAGALADPYILVHTDPQHLLLNKRTPQTTVITKTLSPTWLGETLELFPAVLKTTDLRGTHIILTAMDWDFGSADDTVGHAVLALSAIEAGTASAKGYLDFQLDLTKGGVARGWVRGKASIRWPQEGEVFHVEQDEACCPCTGCVVG